MYPTKISYFLTASLKKKKKNGIFLFFFTQSEFLWNDDAGANKIECFYLAGKLVSDAMQGLNLNHNIAKKYECIL